MKTEELLFIHNKIIDSMTYVEQVIVTSRVVKPHLMT